MSSVNLDLLTAEFPANRETVERVVDFFESRAKKTSMSEKVYSINRIFDVIHPPSQAILAAVLRRLVQQRLIDEFIRVESDSMGIGDFRSIEEIPQKIYDWRKDMDITVQPDQLRLYYKIHA